jgi:hypothetical protein
LRTWLGIAAAVLVLGTGAGVGLALGTHSAAPKAKTLPTVSVPSTTQAAAPLCPLTGTPAPGGTIPQRPAVGIKVDNYPQARPQSGLDKADVVFEEPVEGLITRLVAVFQCQGADSVGDVRSARAVDLQILSQLSHPLFVHAGGIDPVISMLESGPLTDDNLFTHPSLEQHNPNRVAPYATYTSTSAVWGLNPSDTTPPAPIFTYASAAPAGGAPVGSINIPFSSTNNATWTWNPTANEWTLSYSGVPATVAGGGQIAFPNLVVLRVAITYGPWAEQPGSLEVQSQLTGSGPLMVLRNGQAISGTWQRASLTSPASLLAANGSVIPLTPGPTWVEIVPTVTNVTTH